MATMNALNYASQYAQALANAYPNVLRFGALYATPNNGRYRMGEDGKTIYIPRIRTSGRVDADRDSIGFATRNYDNSWEPKTLSFQRKWSTLVHPKDIDQTNMVASIVNITNTFNETQKFPEIDAFTVSRLYTLWSSTDAADAEKTAMVANTEALSAATVLDIFDKLMLNMDNALVPATGRILYCTYEVQKMINAASQISRERDVTGGRSALNSIVTRIDEVEVVPVPKTLMKTAYTFTEGFAPADGAGQIDMFLVHPDAVITPVSYEFAQLDAPSAVTEGKFIYFEESYQDAFILNKRQDALQFHVTAQG